MKIQLDPRLPVLGSVGYEENLNFQLTKVIRNIASQINGLSEGLLVARYNSATAAPTTGKHAQGDIVPNSSPTELGAPGSKYVITGWICTVSGEPGTWVQMRTLTGN